MAEAMHDEFAKYVSVKHANDYRNISLGGSSTRRRGECEESKDLHEAGLGKGREQVSSGRVQRAHQCRC